ncbi:GGDEF domain-containing protein [Motilibacter aurantiacus]|uniref:GGDEF domain-containing protein n=1 Tax=Motilibacter aurantiacus TaxID=2714955 RepID=UPI001E5B1CCD|nr:diguanylate cyclase [Motilibacter aurantiacus]
MSPASGPSAALVRTLPLAASAVAALLLLASGAAALAGVRHGLGALAAAGAAAVGVGVLGVLGRQRPAQADVLAACALLLLSAYAGAASALTGTAAAAAAGAVPVAALGLVLRPGRVLAGMLGAAWAVGLVTAAAAPAPVGHLCALVLGLLPATLLALAIGVQRRSDAEALQVALEAAEASLVRDPLTGLANRQGVELLGTQIVETARRQGDAVHCVIVEADGAGLVAGLSREARDDFLVAVAEALRGATRTTDVVAHWEKAEFWVLGPGPGMPPAELERRVSRRLASDPAVSSDAIALDADRVAASIVAGGAMLAPWDSGTLDTLLARGRQELLARCTLLAETPGPLPRRDPAR